jgi:colicin import membrane protein
MRTTLLSILLSITPAFVTLVRADEEKPDAPRDAKKEIDVREHLEAEKVKFREEMEKHMKAAMEEAAKLEADGKKDAAENLRRQAKEKSEAAIQEHQRAMQAKMEAVMRERAGAERRRVAAEREHAGGERGRAGADRRPDGPPHGDMEGKLRHVQQAVAHLREAGMMDAAENIARLGERMRGSGRGEGGEPRREDGRREDARPDQPRREEGRREEVRREERRPDGDIEALRREIQELRQAVRQLSEKQGERR